MGKGYALFRLHTSYCPTSCGNFNEIIGNELPVVVFFFFPCVMMQVYPSNTIVDLY